MTWFEAIVEKWWQDASANVPGIIDGVPWTKEPTGQKREPTEDLVVPNVHSSTYLGCEKDDEGRDLCLSRGPAAGANPENDNDTHPDPAVVRALCERIFREVKLGLDAPSTRITQPTGVIAGTWRDTTR
jgi:hypothetical protein